MNTLTPLPKPVEVNAATVAQFGRAWIEQFNAQVERITTILPMREDIMLGTTTVQGRSQYVVRNVKVLDGLTEVDLINLVEGTIAFHGGSVRYRPQDDCADVTVYTD